MSAVFASRICLALCCCLLFAGAALAEDWLVYVGGGLEAIEGGWSERHGQVIFTKRGGALVSVPYRDVDLAASTFITWQLNGRRQPPPRASLPAATGAEPASPACTPVRLLALRGSETLFVASGEEPETVHVACLDAPETEHRFSELGWFGRATLSAVRLEVAAGDSLCLTELETPQRDREGHRVVYVTLANGRDYASQLIGGGLGLLRSGSCSRAADYRKLEDGAIADLRGLWGPSGERAAFTAVRQVDGVDSDPAPARRRAVGGG